MYIDRSKEMSRRAFFRRTAQLAVLGAAAPMALNLAAASDAAALTASDYRALVCVFLKSGNDHANTIVPYDLPNYDRYSAIRGGASGRRQGGIALGWDALANTVLKPLKAQALTDDQQLALAPELTGLTSLFNSGRMAIQLNVGNLVVPVTKQQFTSGNQVSYPLPPQLFSHNDQQVQWQSLAAEGVTQGWGGRLGDLALASNQTSGLTCISAAGNSLFVSGRNATAYQIDPTGAVVVNGLKSRYFGSNATTQALLTLMSQDNGTAMGQEYVKVCQRSILMEGTVTSALAGVDVATKFNPSGIANPLADQLHIVARLIAARDKLGMKRQVFFVTLDGFDTHDNLMTDHPRLMAKLNEALTAFYNATVELGVAKNVTTFTASDFGRTLASNGDGSDHGWGSHHFVIGGAVRGGLFYGTAPHVSVTSDDQVGQGRLLPSTGSDQFAATLATWFGVGSGDLTAVLPRIGNFASADLGFMG